MKSSLLVRDFGIKTLLPTWTNGRLQTIPCSIHVCWRPFIWAESRALVPNAARVGTFFDATGAATAGMCAVSCFYLLCLYTLPCSHPFLAAPFSGRCNSSRACRPRPGHFPRYSCRSRAWNVSFVVFFCHNASITPCRCLSLSTTLVVDVTVVLDMAMEVTKVHVLSDCFVFVRPAHTPPVLACLLSYANTAAAEVAGQWFVARTRTRYIHRSFFCSAVAVVVTMASVAMAVLACMASAVPVTVVGVSVSMAEAVYVC